MSHYITRQMRRNFYIMIPGSYVIYESKEAMLAMSEAFRCCPKVNIPDDVHYISEDSAIATLEMSIQYMTAFENIYTM